MLGAALLMVERNYNFVSGVLLGFSAAVGFTLAIVIFAGVREKLKFAEPPEAFRGMGILLIAACLVAMAFSGFSGISFN